MHIILQHTGAASAAPQLVKKSLAEFRVRRRESSTIRFLPRHVRGRKHFTRSERRIVRFRRTTEAQNAAKLSRKSGKAAFSTVSGRGLGLFLLLSMYFVWKTGFRPRLSCHVRPVKSKFRSILAFSRRCVILSMVLRH